MLGEERQQAILAAVEQRHSVSVQELMQLLDISESTIRRDLNALDKEGRLVKVHGGAMAIGGSFHVKDDAVEYRKEGQVFGIGCKIFTIAGPVILYGIFSSWVLGLFLWVLQMFGISAG